MNPNLVRTRILVASDNVDDATQIVRRLELDFTEVHGSTDSTRAVADFDTFVPDVLVFAFDSLTKAQTHAVEVYRFANSHHAHRTLVLCTFEEVRLAFDLCRRGSFDDYLLYWPHVQDGLRLRMSVWNAARENAAQRTTGPSHVELVSHLRQLGQVQAVLDQQVAEEGNHPVARSLRDAEGAIGAAIDDLHRQLAGGHTAGIVDVKDPGALFRAFEQLKHSPVAEVFKGAAQKIAPAAEGARRLKERLAPHLAGLRVLGERVRAVRPVVLYVEDDEIARRLAAEVLESEGYDLVLANDGTAALGLLRSIRPHLIVMDVSLPDIDGVSLTRKLKGASHLADIPVLMLTSDARVKTVESSIKAGAVGFIVKPYTREALLEKIERLVTTARAGGDDCLPD